MRMPCKRRAWGISGSMILLLQQHSVHRQEEVLPGASQQEWD